MADGPYPLRRDVFDALDAVTMRAELYKLRAKDEVIGDPAMAAWIEWLADRVLNVIQTIKDANVTYGIIDCPPWRESDKDRLDDDIAVTPMMVERDAIVGALDAR